MPVDCFLDIHPDSEFSIHNLPFGIFSTKVNSIKQFNILKSTLPRVGVAIGDHVLDCSELQKRGLFNGPFLSNHPNVFTQVHRK